MFHAFYLEGWKKCRQNRNIRLKQHFAFSILVHNRAAHGKVDQAQAGTENDDWPDSFSNVFLPDAADNQVNHQAKQG